MAKKRRSETDAFFLQLDGNGREVAKPIRAMVDTRYPGLGIWQPEAGGECLLIHLPSGLAAAPKAKLRKAWEILEAIGPLTDWNRTKDQFDWPTLREAKRIGREIHDRKRQPATT